MFSTGFARQKLIYSQLLTTNLAAVLHQQTIQVVRKPLEKFRKRSGYVLENLKFVSLYIKKSITVPSQPSLMCTCDQYN